MRDPLFFVEKVYDLLEIGGYFFLSVPEQSGVFGISDKNRYHLWTATAQSVMFTLFHSDQKWHVVQIFEISGILHFMVRKVVPGV